jgi:hypothetical protein
MAHVMFSPSGGMPRVRFEPLVLHAVEDARVNLALAAAGLAVEFDAEHLADVRLRLARELKHREVAVFLLRSVACIGTNALPLARDELGSASPRLAAWAGARLARIEERLERARRRTGQPAAPFRVGQALARELARELRRLGLLDRPLRAPRLGCCVEVGEDEAERRGRRSGPIGRLLHRFRRGDDERGDAVRPGALTVREAEMPLGRAGGRPVGRRHRPAAEGCHLVRPHRFVLDRKVFRRPVRWRGGTVLVDTSGSMRLSPESLDAVVEASGGAALVAIYSGRRCEGELRVVARGGRRARAADLEPYGGGNVVDLPALEWLARQPEPRLWVSDGGVTGEMDRGSEEIRTGCDQVVRRGRIERVDSAEEAVRRLTAVDSRGPRAARRG